MSLVVYAMLQYAVRARDAAFARSEGLLLNVLPRTIAERLKRSPDVIADAYDEVTVLFADIVDFTPFAERTEATRVVGVLNEVFSEFDALAARHGVEKIKTDRRRLHGRGRPARAPAGPRGGDGRHGARDARGVREPCAGRSGQTSRSASAWRAGPVVAGVIGRQKFSYDLWGDTVNTASRMESHGIAGQIQVGEAAYGRLRDRYAFESRGEIDVKGKGRRPAWLLTGRLAG